MSRADGFVTQEAVIAFLRTIGFTFNRQADRTMIWRRSDGSLVFVPRKSQIPIAWVYSQFGQLDLTKEQIEQFLRDSAC